MRDATMTSAYWGAWISFDVESILKKEVLLGTPSGNPSYEPQFIYNLSLDQLHLLLHRYSRGDAVTELTQYFAPMLNYWEEAERLGRDIWTSEQQFTRHTWAVNLDHYIDCFWLVGLALALNIPDAQWQRLLVLIGNEGEDVLLDRIIATRSPGRRIGATLCYPRPYGALLEAIEASKGQQAQKLNRFVERWYKEVGSAAKSGRQKQAVPFKAPYWHNYHRLEGGYFGFWCIEAVAAVLLRLYRLSEEQPIHLFQDEALALVKPMVAFDSAMWGTAKTAPEGIDIHTLHLHEKSPQMMIDYVPPKHLDLAAASLFGLKRGTRAFNTATWWGGRHERDFLAFVQGYDQNNMFITMANDTAAHFMEWISLFRADADAHCTPGETQRVSLLSPHLMQAPRGVKRGRAAKPLSK